MHWNIFTMLWLGLLVIHFSSTVAITDAKNLGCVGSICYSLFDVEVTASEAETNCKSIGGLLAAVKDEETLHHLATGLNYTDQVWIGLKRDALGRGWVFSDGSFLEHMVTEMDFGQHRRSENCAQLHWMKFKEKSCFEYRKYICQVTQLPCDIGDLELLNSAYENCLTNTLVNGSAHINVECFSGYAAKDPDNWTQALELRNNFTVTCFNGTWQKYPRCTSVCSLPSMNTKDISILPKQPFYFMGDSITLFCQDGYFTNQDHPMSHMTLTCSRFNQWEPSSHSLECVPASKFIFAHKQHEEVLMEVEVGQEVVLNCIGKEEPLKSRGGTYVWFRDQHDVRILEDLNYTVIPSNGSLLLHSFNASYEGLYSCYVDDIPGPSAYKIKIRTQCNNATPTLNAAFNEQSSQTIGCPEYDSLTNGLPPTWYKDGTRILGNEKFIILPNGALFIANVTLLDDGRYTCEVSQEKGFCSKSFTTIVSVTSVGSKCGRVVNLKDTPWLVSLWWEEEKAPFCYGARINEQWIVTSASCLFGAHRKKNPDFFIHLGSASGVADNTSHLLPVESAKIHPFYSRRTNYGDIGLVKLRSALNFWKKDLIKPLCLPETDVGLLKMEQGSCQLPKPLTGNTSGWGNLEAAFEKATLKREELTVGSTAECQLPTCGPSMGDSMFCASGTGRRQDMAGDSGSPFDIEWMGQLYLYGIFSWGERASTLGKYDFYTKLSCYTKWITSQIQNN